MIKANLGFNKEREATVLLFGLSHNNIDALIDRKMPIHVKSDELAIKSPGLDVCFFGAKDQKDIGTEIKEIFRTITGTDKGNISVLHIAKKFYVIPFSQISGKQLYLIGLDNTSRDALKAGEWLTFRFREMPKNNSLVSAEVMIFAGETEAAMEESLRNPKLDTKPT